MENLLQKLQKFQHLSPDEIVAHLNPPTAFDVRTFRPWTPPPELAGRYVVIAGRNHETEGDTDWWHSPGSGSSTERPDRAVAWPIQDAFDRFVARERFQPYSYYVVLHLVEPNDDRIPNPEAEILSGRYGY